MGFIQEIQYQSHQHTARIPKKRPERFYRPGLIFILGANSRFPLYLFRSCFAKKDAAAIGARAFASKTLL